MKFKLFLASIFFIPLMFYGQNDTLDSMEEITIDNLLNYLGKLPQEDSSYISEEIHTDKVPETWKQIGILYDKRIGANYVMYKPWNSYALGFYPYSGCEIYIDESSRIYLSYVELGGHFPFRRNYLVTKKSPFIIEPISCDIEVEEDKNDIFISALANYGLSKEKMELDLLEYKYLDQINHELNVNETLVINRHFDSVNKIYRYTIITTRENAINLKTLVSH